jgi:hypothetical protein
VRAHHDVLQYQGPLDALRRLDWRLQRAVDTAVAKYGRESLTDPFHGLYLSAEQLARPANGTAGEHASPEHDPATLPAWDTICEQVPLWDWLQATFDLSPFDLDLVLVALAPEVDRRYERVYAYLQDEVSRKQPSVDLDLDLCCASADERVPRRAHFGADAPLLRHRLMSLLPDPHQSAPTLLNHYLKLDEQIVDALLGQGGLDRRLASFCRLIDPSATPDTPGVPPALLGLQPAWRGAHAARHPLRIYLHGPPGSTTLPAAEAIAADLDLRLLHADLAQAVAAGGDLDRTLGILLREAWFHDALLYLEGLDALRGATQSAAFDGLLRRLVADPSLVLLAGSLPWPATSIPVQMLVVPFPRPDFNQRRALWQTALAATGRAVPRPELDELAARFRLTPAQITNAAVQLQHREPTRDLLFAAARAQTGPALDGLAHKLTPLHTWDDLVLTADALVALREIGQRVAYDQRVLGEWGFGRKLSLGRGVSALFAGPSGTGKTMAAEVLAADLGLDLYRIDLSTIVSKYIGETEQNLERVFAGAENANVILFFDEADAIFGRRSEVRDSHDRYANLEIAYLLQRMEQYEGLAILATNLRENLDEAFVRRLQFIINFPFPDEPQRLRLWELHLPAETPRDDDLDLAYLAKRFRLSGGSIKNVTLAAAFLAAAEDRPIGQRHLLQALRREHQKMGMVLSESDLAPTRGDPNA